LRAIHSLYGALSTEKIMKVSVFASAVRTQLWEKFYNDIKATNKTEFEVVFVGPYAPSFTLPDNFRFIQTNVKPAQCFEIAARNSVGDVLLQTADDIVYTPHAIDLMYEAYMSDPGHIMSTCKYYSDEADFSAYQNLLGNPSDTFPILPVCGMYSREMYHKLGGADRRFRAMQWELDMYMRMWAAGMKTVFVDGRAIEVYSVGQQTPSGLRLGNVYWEADRKTILGLYTINGVLGTTRNDKVESFSDENILTISQGA